MKKKVKQNTASAPKSETCKNELSLKAVGSAREKSVNRPPLDLPLSDTWYDCQKLMTILNVKRTVIDGFIKSGVLISHKWGGTMRINKAYFDWMLENGKRVFPILAFLLTMESDCLIEL